MVLIKTVILLNKKEENKCVFDTWRGRTALDHGSFGIEEGEAGRFAWNGSWFAWNGSWFASSESRLATHDVGTKRGWKKRCEGYAYLLSFSSFFLGFLFLALRKEACVSFVNKSSYFQTWIALQERSKKSQQINFTSLDVNSYLFLSKSHQKNKRVYDDRF